MPPTAPGSRYDIFISYRRDGGDAQALFIREKLMQRGLRVFLDVTDLRKGYFDEALLNYIAETPNFLVILSLQSLDRCAAEGDWLRLEIAQAVKTRKNIIPVMMPSFRFPNQLPEDIQTLPRHQGVEYSHSYHVAMIDSIVRSVEAEREESAPPAPALETRQQDRVLDAALPVRVPLGKPSELVAMIRQVSSAGLREILGVHEDHDAAPEDVRSKPFDVEFPVDPGGRLRSAEVVLKLEAPDFDPPSQTKKVLIPPEGDSKTFSFLVTPKFPGELRLNLEVCKGDVYVASRLLKTTAEPSDRSVFPPPKVLVSVPLVVTGYASASAGTPTHPAPEPPQSRPSGPPPGSRGPLPPVPRAMPEPAPRTSRAPSVGSSGTSAGTSAGPRVAGKPGTVAELLGVGPGPVSWALVLVFVLARLGETLLTTVIRTWTGPGGTGGGFGLLLVSVLVGSAVIIAVFRWIRGALPAALLAAAILTAASMLLAPAFSLSSAPLGGRLHFVVATFLTVAVFLLVLAWALGRVRSLWWGVFLAAAVHQLTGVLFLAAYYAIRFATTQPVLQLAMAPIYLLAALIFTVILVGGRRVIKGRPR